MNPCFPSPSKAAIAARKLLLRGRVELSLDVELRRTVARFSFIVTIKTPPAKKWQKIPPEN